MKPKKTKFNKFHNVTKPLFYKQKTVISNGTHALIALESAILTDTQLKSASFALKRKLQRRGKS